MKTLKATGVILFTAIAFLAFTLVKRANAQPGVSVSFQLFYDELAPYGEWVDDPEYGYLWLPNAGGNFQPYATNGHWVMTNYGNTWVSGYDWGWAPFHYGRWLYTDYYGWAWVPGYEWGPAWVDWRSGGGYYGWAPMSVRVNIGIPHHHWVFVPQRYITSTRIYNYYVPRRNRVNIYNRTTIINNTYVYNNRTYASGPRRNEIERATRSRISVRNIEAVNRPGRARVNSRSVSLYRPNVDRNSRSSARPARVSSASDVRAAGNRSTTRPANSRSTTTRAERPATRNNRATAPRGRTRNNEAVTPRSENRRSGDAVRPSGNTRGESRSRNIVRPSSRTSGSERAVQSRSTRVQNRQNRTNERSSVRPSSARNRSSDNSSRVRASSSSSRTPSRPAVSSSRSSRSKRNVTRSSTRPAERSKASSSRRR